MSVSQPKKKMSIGLKLFIGICLILGFMVFVYPSLIPDPEFDDSSIRTIEWKNIPEDQNGLASLAAALECAGGDDILQDAAEFLGDRDTFGKRVFTGDTTKYLECRHFVDEAIEKPFFEYSRASENESLVDMPGINIGQLAKLISILVAIDSAEKENRTPAETRLALMRYLELGNKLESAKGSSVLFVSGLRIKHEALAEIVLNIDTRYFSQEDVKQIAESLSKYASPDSAMDETLRIEYIWGLESMDAFIEELNNPQSDEQLDVLPAWYSKYAIKHLYKPNKTKRLVFEDFKRMLDNVGRPLSEMEFRDAQYPTIGSLFRAYMSGEIIPALLLPVSDSSIAFLIRRHLEFNALLNMVEVKAAITQYKVDHGKMPENLEALVPQYFAEIPTDPFVGKPLLFDKERGAIYSVGVNMEDEGKCGPMQWIMPDFSEYDYETDLCLMEAPENSL